MEQTTREILKEAMYLFQERVGICLEGGATKADAVHNAINCVQGYINRVTSQGFETRGVENVIKNMAENYRK